MNGAISSGMHISQACSTRKAPNVFAGDPISPLFHNALAAFAKPCSDFMASRLNVHAGLRIRDAGDHECCSRRARPWLSSGQSACSSRVVGLCLRLIEPATDHSARRRGGPAPLRCGRMSSLNVLGEFPSAAMAGPASCSDAGRSRPCCVIVGRGTDGQGEPRGEGVAHVVEDLLATPAGEGSDGLAGCSWPAVQATARKVVLRGRRLGPSPRMGFLGCRQGEHNDALPRQQ